MTNEQIKVFEELLADETFKGKQQLKHLLWLNTSKPQLDVGDCFIVSDRGHKIYGHHVSNFKAKVVRIYSWKDSEEWQYELSMDVECEGKTTTSMVYKTETELLRAEQCIGNKNILGDAKDIHSTSIDA